ncbi:MAG: GDSL-type esterase/lipase family protein, partial [Geitlerinemataceae cyanobacterium]
MSRLLLATGFTAIWSVFASIAVSATAVAQSSESMEIAARDRDPSPFPTSDLATPKRSDFGREQPASGSQLYHQRLAALRSNQLYTRLSGNSFQSDWMGAMEQPTYEQWKALLVEEAQLVVQVPETSRLSIVLGDSLSLWMPSGGLPEHQLWLNQGISGDTTRGILDRLSAIAGTHADRIYILAGVNDLKNGVEDGEILDNYRQILRQLKQEHPQTEAIVQSILPTRLETIPNDRIRQLNHQLAAIAQQEGATFLNLSTYLADAQGELHPSLTTDGLHLNDRGYEAWQWVLQQ